MSEEFSTVMSTELSIECYTTKARVRLRSLSFCVRASYD